MKKKVTGIVVLLMIVTCMIPAMAQEPMGVRRINNRVEFHNAAIGPHWNSTSSVIFGVDIDDSRGCAYVSAEVCTYHSTDRVDLTVTLQKSSGASWVKEKAWTTSGTGGCVTLDKEYYVGRGTYRVYLVAKVYDSAGKLKESISLYSNNAVY